jgi:hypothetical protein
MIPLEEEGDGLSQLLSSVNVADPSAEPQLLRGFYPLEQGTWRWTAKSFSVILAAPPPVEGHQADLDLRATLPDALQQYLPITLSAEINHQQVGAHVFSELVREQLVTISIPEGVLTAEPALVEFTLDKGIEPSESDGRDLGMVITSVAIK